MRAGLVGIDKAQPIWNGSRSGWSRPAMAVAREAASPAMLALERPPVVSAPPAGQAVERAREARNGARGRLDGLLAVERAALDAIEAPLLDERARMLRDMVERQRTSCEPHPYKGGHPSARRTSSGATRTASTSSCDGAVTAPCSKVSDE